MDISGRRAGAALVEFVLIVPMFLLLVFGAIEFASAYNDSAVVADAARRRS